MPILVPLLLLAVLAALWWQRRGSTLTRDCRWRLDRAAGAEVWRCAVCGAVTEGARSPRHCLRERG
ncbi:zinc finger domain-containing protein [Tabrizicola sp. M-4]|uniref:zinc finger domain-containing protein n=1 Tax=Tabrizicola sp. M-4 TaxID=3055847 RepID=UPI003DA8F736